MAHTISGQAQCHTCVMNIYNKYMYVVDLHFLEKATNYSTQDAFSTITLH